MQRDVYHAIADPTRRAIIDLIIDTPMNVKAIALHFATVSRPAISQHLKVLEECGVVGVTTTGRQRLYSATLHPLDEVVAWITQRGRLAAVPPSNSLVSEKTKKDKKADKKADKKDGKKKKKKKHKNNNEDARRPSWQRT
jgi:DNA-binding transcriptional ArsR family regulator